MLEYLKYTDLNFLFGHGNKIENVVDELYEMLLGQFS